MEIDIIFLLVIVVAFVVGGAWLGWIIIVVVRFIDKEAGEKLRERHYRLWVVCGIIMAIIAFIDQYSRLP